jgi:hypothetical protein
MAKITTYMCKDFQHVRGIVCPLIKEDLLGTSQPNLAGWISTVSIEDDLKG